MTSMTTTFNRLKEQFLRALDGELLSGDGETYKEASEADCRAQAISIFDYVVCAALEAAQSGRALEKVMESNGVNPRDPQIFKDYQHFVIKDEKEYKTREEYHFGDKEDSNDF